MGENTRISATIFKEIWVPSREVLRTRLKALDIEILVCLRSLGRVPQKSVARPEDWPEGSRAAGLSFGSLTNALRDLRRRGYLKSEGREVLGTTYTPILELTEMGKVALELEIELGKVLAGGRAEVQEVA